MRLGEYWSKVKWRFARNRGEKIAIEYPHSDQISVVRFFKTDNFTIDTVWVEITDLSGEMQLFFEDDLGFWDFTERLRNELPLADWSIVMREPFEQIDCVAYDRNSANS